MRREFKNARTNANSQSFFFFSFFFFKPFSMRSHDHWREAIPSFDDGKRETKNRACNEDNKNKESEICCRKECRAIRRLFHQLELSNRATFVSVGTTRFSSC